MKKILTIGCLALAPSLWGASVEELWAGFDPRSAPLESEIVQELRHDGITLRKIRYTSEVANGFKVRVIGYYGFHSAKGEVPAVLHIHGGGQTATREYVELWARRGYAALSINWGGYPLERDATQGNTDWGPIHANQQDTTNTYRVIPNPRVNSWFHWTIACRRGLTFLEQQPEVDPARIGIFGVSMGGRLTWLVAGLDDRVKAAASIYGAVSMSDPIPGIPDSEQIRTTKDDAAVWRASLDAISYAPRIRCPFFFLSAADDFYGAMDFVDQAIGRIPHPRKWQSYTPHFNHHVEPEQSAALPMWMDRWLKDGAAWPKSPQARLQFENGQTRVTIEADGAKDAAIYYSIDPYPQSRFWRSAAAVKRSGKWTASLPVTETGRGLWVFANVLYESGLSLSTRLATASAEDLRKAGVKANDPPIVLIEDFSAGARDWFVPTSGPNPMLNDKRFFRTLGAAVTPDDEQGPLWRLATRKPGDPKWRGTAGAALQLRVRSAQANTMLVLVTENEYRRPKPARSFVAAVYLKGGDWETVKVALSDFRELDSEAPLLGWEDVNLLSLQAQHVIRGPSRTPADQRTIGDRWQGPMPEFGRIEWVK